MSILKGLFGQGQNAAGSQWMGQPVQHQAPAMTASQVAQQQAQWQNQLGALQNNYQQAAQNMAANMVGASLMTPNWNDHVPVWDEGGYEPWLGKPQHRTEHCQRCMFL